MDSNDQAAPSYLIRVAPRLPWVLAGVATTLLLIHVGLQVYHYRFEKVDPQVVAENGEGISWLARNLFDVDQKNNIPTWYSQAMLLTVSFLMLGIANAKRQDKKPYAGHWLGLSIVLAFVAIDQDIALHDTLGTLADHFAGVEHNSLEVGGLILTGIFALIYLRFWLKLPPRTRLLYGLSGVGYVFGAVGVEHLSSLMNTDTLGYNLMTVWEEGFKMYFTILFLYANLDYMLSQAGAPGSLAIDIDVADNPAKPCR